MVPLALSNKKLLLGALIALIGLALSACAPYQARRVPLRYHSVGVASWYGPGFHGRRTASGERYNQRELTAAHKTLPFGTSIRVTNVDNGKSVVVRITDRGPFVRGRVIDLSRAAAEAIGMMGAGTAKVELSTLEMADNEEAPRDGLPAVSDTPKPLAKAPAAVDDDKF